MELTRREFLRLTGGTLLAGGILPEGVPALVQRLPLAGRVLRYTPVLAAPAAGEVVRHLWPDAMVTLEGAAGNWFRVPGGVVARRDLQPMLPYDAAAVQTAPSLPQLMTVVAPIAPVRAWAAGDAPLIARIGYGGVVWAIDALTEAGAGWYAVRDSAVPERPVLGWTPAERWSLPPDVSFEAGGSDAVRLQLDREAAEARLLVGDRIWARFPAAVGKDARGGSWRVESREPCGSVDGEHGAGWLLSWPGGLLFGAHWHHDLGGPGTDPGWAVAPWAARWLYDQVLLGTPVDVV